MRKKGFPQVWNRLDTLYPGREPSGTADEISAQCQAVFPSQFQDLIHMTKNAFHLRLFPYEVRKEIHSDNSLSADQFLQMLASDISWPFPHLSYIGMGSNDRPVRK